MPLTCPFCERAGTECICHWTTPIVNEGRSLRPEKTTILKPAGELNNTEKIERVIHYFEYLTEAVDAPLSKPWLIPALTSHIQRDTGYRANFIKNVLDIIYLIETMDVCKKENTKC